MIPRVLAAAALAWGTVCMAADTSTAIFHPAFSALRVAPEGYPLASPTLIRELGDRVEISFDERADDRRWLRYELLHCNADWQPSRLLAPEYIDGFNEGVVPEPQHSRLAENRYMHYAFTVPSDDLAPTVSGNYLVRVYDEDDPDRTLLQARIRLADMTAPVTASVSPRTDVDYRDAHQQLTVSVDTERIPDLADPFAELTLVVEQNGRADNVATVSTPSRMQGRTAVYEHKPSLIFPAGNEYRRFETVTLRYTPMGVESVVRADPFRHFILHTDSPRASTSYIYDSTQQGRCLVRNADFDGDDDLQADYCLVHFALDMPRMTDADIYIDGDLTLRRFGPDSRMIYNEERGVYEATLLLKQGAYNYQYLTVPHGRSTGETGRVEGDKWQTVNEYAVFLYHRPRGARADRLVGTTIVRSDGPAR